MKTWWCGPEWLTLTSSSWPCTIPCLPVDANMEERPKPVLTTVRLTNLWDLVERYSSLSKLLRVTARVMLATCRFRRRLSGESSLAPLTPAQLKEARLFWIWQTQASYFSEEIRILKRGESLPKSSNLRLLTPYLDNADLLRLGGRLENSLMDLDSKHPLVLPRASALTSLLIREAHLRTLHGGTQLTLSTFRQQVWIIGGRAPVRSAILRCVTCATRVKCRKSYAPRRPKTPIRV